MALKVIRALRVNGQRVTLNRRVVGARDAHTGAAAITYGDDETIRAFIGRPQMRAIATELGDVTDVLRSFVTSVDIGKLDKVTLDDGVYYVRDTPTEIHRAMGDNERMLYRTSIVRDPLG